MQRHAPLLTALVLSSVATTAQVEWSKQAPLPVGAHVGSVAVISPTEVWCTATFDGVSSAGLVHTKDGGLTWESVVITGGSVDSVFFTDALHGWAAGNGFYHTTDGGQTWVQDNTWGSISDLFFLDNTTGWACGNGSVTYRTTDGGLNWSAVSAGGGHTLSSIWFVDAQNGWCLDIGGRIFKTTDGGQTWSTLYDSGLYLATVQFFDTQEGWAIGGDTFLHTTDGGQTWSQAAVPVGTWVHSARFADKLRGIAAGQSDNVVRTIDGGQTWTTAQPQGNVGILWDVEYPSPSVAFLAGAVGTIARSIDQGASWDSLQSGGSGTAFAIDFVDDKHAWAASDLGEVLVTTDGGALWVRRSVDGLSGPADVEDVDFADTSSGWAVGMEGTSGQISRSTDGGNTWQLQRSSSGGVHNAVCALDAQTAYVAGGNANEKVLRTVDGGLTWTNVSPPSSASYNDVFFLDASLGWVAGTRIFRTTDGGQTWTEQYNGTVVSAIEFADAQNGWAVGYAGLVLRTQDGGSTWVAQNAGEPAGAAILDVSVIDSKTAWICGWFGFVASTRDRGVTWQAESVPGSDSATAFEGIAFLDAKVGWVGASNHDGIWRRGGTPYSLTASPAQLSLTNGGTQSFELDAGVEWAGDLYVLLGSASGTSPGFPVDSAVVPLNPSDLWFVFTLLHANTPPLSQSLGLLDAEGKASASLTIPPAAPPELEALTLNHAFVVLDLSALNHVSFASNPVSLTFSP